MTSDVKTRFASGASVQLCCRRLSPGYRLSVLFLDDSPGFILVSFLYLVNIILEDLGENML